MKNVAIPIGWSQYKTTTFNNNIITAIQKMKPMMLSNRFIAGELGNNPSDRIAFGQRVDYSSLGEAVES